MVDGIHETSKALLKSRIEKCVKVAKAEAESALREFEATTTAEIDTKNKHIEQLEQELADSKVSSCYHVFPELPLGLIKANRNRLVWYIPPTPI